MDIMDSSEEDFAEDIVKAGLVITRKRKCLSKKIVKNATEKKPKLNFVENLDIENLQIVEKIGDEYRELASEIVIESEVPFPSVCASVLPDLLEAREDVLPSTSKPNEALILLVCEPLASPTKRERIEDVLPNLKPNEPPKSPVLLVCSPPSSPSLLGMRSDSQLHPSPDMTPEGIVPLMYLPSSSSAVIDVPDNQLYPNAGELYDGPALPVCSPHASTRANIQLSLNQNEPQPSASPLTDRTTQPCNKVTIISDVPYCGDITQHKKRNNKATMDATCWQRNKDKQKREKGESYLGYRRDRKVGADKKFKVIHDVFKPARSMNPPCMSSFCGRSKLRACDGISSESRQGIFTTFWKNMPWEQRRAFICSHVVRIEKKVTKSVDSNRCESRAYFLTIEHNRYQVCKKMFLATLGIKDWFVRYWLKKTDCAMPPDSQTSQKGKKGPEKTDSKNYLTQFLTKLPKMPSHYCRESTSKLYLEPVFQSMSELYNVYKNACEVDSKQCLGRKLFDSVFKSLNIALFHPKKDQCDLCCSHKVGNLGDEEYNRHITNKNRARAEKATDKLYAQTEMCHVFTQDVESVKLAPFLLGSAVYYKTKLCVHNYTIYNLATQDVMCYWFDESNSTLEASVFASCLVDHISKTLSTKSLPVILYSDGCCAQNRNAILSNALLRLAIEHKVVITQKYLEKGHTQMECDSVHSAIECKVKGKEIYLPDQYVTIRKKARRHPRPYDAKLLDYTFFTDFSQELIYKSIRPGKKTGDPVVTDLRVLEYRPDGIIQYKTSFDEDLKPLPLRSTPLYRIKPINELPKLYTGRLPIASRKYQDLQDLKAIIPESCHAFYDLLPHN